MRLRVRESLRNGHRWMVVAAGLALLVIQPNVVLLAEPVERAAQAEARDDRLETTLLRVNPRLGPVTTSRIKSAVQRWGEVGEEARPYIKGALGYYIADDDAAGDLESAAGFDDDLEVVNACLRFAGLDDLVVSPTDS